MNVTSLSLIQFIITVVSASLATFLGSAAVESIKNRSKGRQAQRDYKAQLAIELDQLAKLVSRLKTDYKARAFYLLNLLEILASAIIRTEERLKQLTLLKDDNLYRDVFEVITDLRILVIETDNMERYHLAADIDATEKARRNALAVKERPEKNAEFTETQRRLNDIIKIIKQ